MPAFFADTVEFLRGSSSALYGSGAMNGVINVRPLEAASTSGIEVLVAGATRDNIWRGMANAWFTSDLGTTTMSLGLFDRDASKQLIGSGGVYPNWLYNNRRDAQFAYLKHRVDDGLLEGLSAGIIFSRLSSGLGEGIGSERKKFRPINDATWDYFIPYLKFESSFGVNSGISSYFSYNGSQEVGVYANNTTQTSLEKSRFRSSTEALEFQRETATVIFSDTHIRAGMNLGYQREHGQPDSYFRELRDGQLIQFPAVFADTTPWFRDMAAFDINFRLKLFEHIDLELKAVNLFDRDNHLIPTMNNEGQPDQAMTFFGSILLHHD